MLKRCAVCKEYFPEPEVQTKTGGYRHDNCSFFARSDLEIKMEKEMNAFRDRHPYFFQRLAKELPEEVKK